MSTKNQQKIVVEKFGGTSVGGRKEQPEKIKRLAEYIISQRAGGNLVIPVVSAMAGVTNSLLNEARIIDPRPDPRSLDMLLFTGEVESAAMLAIALNGLGQSAIPLSGYQMGLTTTSVHSSAEIISVRNAKTIRQMAMQGIVPVCAGFQGVDLQGNFTTLGRGASDLTAIALAAALETECIINTDVDGVFVCNPRIVKGAKKFRQIEPMIMLNMAWFGSKVLMDRCVLLADRLGVPVIVRLSPSFNEKSEGGTLVSKHIRTPEEMEVDLHSQTTMIEQDVTAVVLSGVPNIPNVGSQIFSAISQTVVVETLQSMAGMEATITLLVKDDDSQNAAFLIERGMRGKNIGIAAKADLTLIQIYDINMRGGAGWMARFTGALGHAGINIEAVLTSAFRIAGLVKRGDKEKAMLALAEEFGMIEKEEDKDLE